MAGEQVAEVSNVVFAGASLDRATNPVLTQGFSRLDGVDAREQGSLRKFPGFTRLKIPFAFTDGALGYVQGFEVQKGNESAKLRGRVTLDTTNNVLSANFYDTQNSIWRHQVLASDATGTADDISVATSGKWLFFTYNDGSSVVAKVFYYDSTNSTFNVETMGVGFKDNSPSDLDVDAAGAAGGGTLSGGEYVVAFRLRNTRRNVITGLSGQLQVTAVASNKITASGVTVSLPTDWVAADTKIQLYRTIADGTRFYLEKEIAYTTTAGSYIWGDAVGSGGLSDERLVLKNDIYENNLDAVGLVPATNRIGTLQGITVMRLIGDEEEHAVTDLVFSPSHEYRPENFPRNQIYRLESDLGPIIQFVSAGDYLIAFTPVAMLRMQKVGTQFTVNTVHFGWGPKSRSGMVSIGSSVLVVSTKGIYLTNGNDGSMSTMGAVDRLVTNENEWVADIDADLGAAIPNIHCATDEALGATFVVNNAKRQALVFWHGSGRITTLDDFPWNFSLTMPHPEDGGPRRAFFVGPKDASGNFFQQATMWSADVNRTDSLTMLGVNSTNNTLNGTLTSAGTDTQLIDTGGAWDDDVLGATAHVFTRTGGVENAPSSATLTTSGDTTLKSFDGSTETDLTVESDATEQFTPGNTVLGRTAFELLLSGGAGDRQVVAIFDTTTYSASDEPYRVRVDLIQTDNDSAASQMDTIEVWGRLSRNNNLREGTTPAAAGYGLIWNWSSSTTTRDGTSLAANSLFLVERDATPSLTILATLTDATKYAKTAVPVQGPIRLELRFSGTSIAGYFNGDQVITATDSTLTSGYVAFGSALDGTPPSAGDGPMVDTFSVIKEAGTTTLTLDSAITGKATGDRYTISSVPMRVSLPPVGGEDRLFRRAHITSIIPFITNITAPADTSNSKLRVQAFRAGSETEETGVTVDLTTVVSDMAGHVLAQGLGMQPGFEYHEAGGDIEVVSLRTVFEQGDSTEI